MNLRSWTHWFVFCVLAGLLTSPAYADMRCGSRLISRGDSLYDVRSLCGVPDAAQQRVEYRTARRVVQGPCFRQQNQLVCSHVEERSVEVVIDEWTYDIGSNRFIRTLTFEQGRLRDVATGRYGQK